ncbi:DUF4214 domain-containing protein [Pseudomaricurvus alkylphenolicus]|uniref:DUF4214 domain-containing protein n=1 Tax=Pseudomaricurvus alkylphenolicus TaxID=1306991 RepID=UPI00197EE52C|nr:DUF4214 domain-containing protein [Pseudomaricurvus alkylphenolicus]
MLPFTTDRTSITVQIQEIYIGLLGRGAAQAGLDYWEAELTEGRLTIEQLRANIVNEQPEYQQRLGGATREVMVIQLYEDLFGRNPDQAGLYYWLYGGGQSVNADQLVLALINGASAADRKTLDEKVAAAQAYTDEAGDDFDLEAAARAIDLPDNSVTLEGTEEGELLEGGSGYDEINGNGGDDQLEGKSGNDVLSGGAGDDDLDGGSGDDTLLGGEGEDFLDGGSGDDLLEGNGDDDQLDGGSGNDTLVGGAGDDILTGDGDDDRFVFTPGDGMDTITDFSAGESSSQADKIDLSGFGAFDDFTDVQDAAEQDGDDTVIDLGGGDQLTLLGVTATDLHENDFIF